MFARRCSFWNGVDSFGGGAAGADTVGGGGVRERGRTGSSLLQASAAGGVARLGRLEAKVRVADAHHVARADRRRARDALAIDERARRAVDVSDGRGPVGDLQLTVDLRNVQIVEHDVGAPVAADARDRPYGKRLAEIGAVDDDEAIARFRRRFVFRLPLGRRRLVVFGRFKRERRGPQPARAVLDEVELAALSAALDLDDGRRVARQHHFAAN